MKLQPRPGEFYYGPRMVLTFEQATIFQIGKTSLFPDKMEVQVHRFLQNWIEVPAPHSMKQENRPSASLSCVFKSVGE